MQNLKLFYEESDAALVRLLTNTIETTGKIMITVEPIASRNQTNFILVGDYRYSPKNQSLQYKNEDPAFLTILENKVFQMLLENVYNIVPREVLLSAFWSHVSYYSSRSLDIIIYKLRNKTQKDPTIKITTHRGIGFSIRY